MVSQFIILTFVCILLSLVSSFLSDSLDSVSIAAQNVTVYDWLTNSKIQLSKPSLYPDGSDIASWRMSIGLFYGMVYGMVVKNYLGTVSFSFIFLTGIFIYFKKNILDI